MPNKHFNLIAFFLVCLAIHCPKDLHSQTLKTIESLEQATQKHLDEGVNMLGYTSAFYVQMDSLLNVSYNRLRKKLPVEEKEALKTEQLAWLKKRDAYFKKVYRDQEKESGVAKNDWGELEYLIVYHAQVEFVKDRVIVLISRLNGTPN